MVLKKIQETEANPEDASALINLQNQVAPANALARLKFILTDLRASLAIRRCIMLQGRVAPSA